MHALPAQEVQSKDQSFIRGGTLHNRPVGGSSPSNSTTQSNQADSPVIFTHQFVSRVLKTHWDAQSGHKAVILIFDGLRVDAWEELVRPVLEEKYDVIEELPGSAILPTETNLSRKAE
jgi:hypothetical protein